MQEKPNAQGQPMKPHCRNLGNLKPELEVDVRVHTKARTVVRAKNERSEMKGHEPREDMKRKRKRSV